MAEIFEPKMEQEYVAPISQYPNPAAYLGEEQTVSQYPNLAGQLTKPEVPWYESLGQGIAKAGPFLNRLGWGIAGGANTSRPSYTGQTIGAVQPMLEGMALNSALKKMMSDYLGGKSTNLGPTGSPEQAGIDDLSALGLTPEGVKFSYGMGMEATEKARTEPFRMMALAADAHNRIAAGDLHAAQIPQVMAQTEAILANLDQMPVKSWVEFQEKQMHMFKLQADLQKMQADMERMKIEGEKTKVETEKIKKVDIPRGEAETKKTLTEERGLRQSQYWNTEEGRTIKADIDAWEQRNKRGLEKLELSDRVIVYDPQTGQERTWQKGIAPGTEAGKVGETGRMSNAIKAAASDADVMQMVNKAIVAKFPNDKAKQFESMQNLRMMLDDPLKGEQAAYHIRGLLGSKEQAIFNDRVRQHTSSSLKGELYTPSGETPNLQPPSGGLSTAPSKIPEKGKPVLDVNEILPAAMKKFQGKVAEKEIKQWVYDTYGKPKNIPKTTTDAWVTQNLMK